MKQNTKDLSEDDASIHSQEGDNQSIVSRDSSCSSISEDSTENETLEVTPNCKCCKSSAEMDDKKPTKSNIDIP